MGVALHIVLGPARGGPGELHAVFGEETPSCRENDRQTLGQEGSVVSQVFWHYMGTRDIGSTVFQSLKQECKQDLFIYTRNIHNPTYI